LSLKVDLEAIEQKIVLRLEGRIDAATSPLLERQMERLIQEKHHHLLLDLNQVDYLSSAGLRLLLSMSKKLQSLKGFLILFSLAAEVEEIVKMAGFDRVLLLFANEKDALQYRPKSL